MSYRVLYQNSNMKKIILAILSLVVLVACNNKQSESTQAATESKTIETAQVESGLPTVLDFSATWCPPCQQFKPIFEEVKEKYAGQVDMKTIDVDQNRELAEKYNISSIPAIIFLDADGKEIDRNVGFMDKETLEESIHINFNIKKIEDNNQPQ